MKIYSTRLRLRIIISVGVLLLFVIVLVNIISIQSSLARRFIAIAIMTMFGFMSYKLSATKFLVDSNRIQRIMNLKSMKVLDELNWKNTTKVESFLGLTSATIFLTLYSNEEGSIRKFGIVLSSYSLGLLNDILTNIPSNVIIDLHPSLRESYIKEYGDGIFRRFSKQLN